MSVADVLATSLAIASLVPVPFLLESVSILIEVLTPRTLEEEVLLFQTRSQHIGSLSAVVSV